MEHEELIKAIKESSPEGESVFNVTVLKAAAEHVFKEEFRCIAINRNNNTVELFGDPEFQENEKETVENIARIVKQENGLHAIDIQDNDGEISSSDLPLDLAIKIVKDHIDNSTT